MKIAELISNKKTIIHPERYKLSEPMSPHVAAQLDKVRISPPILNYLKQKIN